jgi:mannonate dehydratase
LLHFEEFKLSKLNNIGKNKYMALEQTWRWFGPRDPISLEEIKQTGATGIVTALHHIPVGDEWAAAEILQRKNKIEQAGLVWSVVESMPVHEDIKKGTGSFKKYIENYKQTIRNLGQSGIDTICYNFMPVLDWSRTNLKVVFNDGAITTKFESKVFAAFDLFILKRPEAEEGYDVDQIAEANKYYKALNDIQKQQLTDTVLHGLPGSLQAYTLDEFRVAISAYRELGEDGLRNNLHLFIRSIIPVAEEAGIRLAIHPDDPPWSLLGLPRVVGNEKDIASIVNTIDSPANGITLCTGSFGAEYKNNLVQLTEKFSHRINFIHLRNLTRTENHDFMEAYHMDGDIDLYGVMKTLLLEQQRRIKQGRKDYRLPMRPDHGHLTIPEKDKQGIYPGYSLFGRMRGLAELRGMELGIRRSLGIP